MKAASLVGLFAVGLAAPAVAAAPPPKVSIASFDELNPPEVPYDVTSNAARAVGTAFARARKSHKRVLIDFGGNWCGDCRILAGVMELPEMRHFLAAHYEVVSVNVGRYDANLAIPARFGYTTRLEGVPTVLIATPQGEVLNRGDVFALTDARHMTPQAVANWLAKWAA